MAFEYTPQVGKAVGSVKIRVVYERHLKKCNNRVWGRGAEVAQRTIVHLSVLRESRPSKGGDFQPSESQVAGDQERYGTWSYGPKWVAAY